MAELIWDDVEEEDEEYERIEWDSLFLEMAILVAERSGCKRLQVGCVILSPDYQRILSFGYNGSYSGGPNTCDRPDEPGNCGCDAHAEINAIAKCDNYVKDKIFYISANPCRRCATMMVNSGAARVVCLSTYRSTEGLDLLKAAGVEVDIVDPNEVMSDITDDDEDNEEDDEIFG